MSSPYWVEQESGLLVPEIEPFTSYPGNDAWLEIGTKAVAPGADPAWLEIESVPDTGAIPNKTVTWSNPGVGSAPTTQDATSVFGGSSLLMGGSGSALTTPDHPDWRLGSTFTIEGRYRWAVIRKALLTQLKTDNSDRGWEWTMDIMGAATPGFSFMISTGDGTAWDAEFDQAFNVTLNQWYHMAVVRNGSVLRFFVDGVQVGADANIGAAVIRDSGAPLRIGGDARTTGNDFQGYMDEVRISNVARWTGTSFTVPTAPYTRDANTLLLMHCDGPNGGTAYTDSSGVPGTPFDPGPDPAWLEIER